MGMVCNTERTHAHDLAGATAWAMTDPPFDWPDTKADVKAWADAHPCITKY